MQNTFLVGLSRQVALSRELDVVANNIANINTNGYKADGSLFEEYLASNARSDTGGRVSYVRDRGVWHDMGAGPTEHTGNPLDLAIDGDGFFAVQTPRGERYTRNGALHLNSTGQLVTSEGDLSLKEIDRHFGANGKHLQTMRGVARLTLDAADHTLTPYHARRALIARLIHFGLDTGPHAASLPVRRPLARTADAAGR